MLPTFLVIGAAKCGTTSVCEILREHPEVFVTEPKEPGYFAKTSFRAEQPWYENLFEGAESWQARGEGSVAYTLPGNVETAARRISRLVPDCRLIYMVRDPIRRLESDWRMRRLEWRRMDPLAQAVRKHPNLITIGAYWRHVSVYRRHFPDEQILVVFLEDFARDPETEMRRILEHIGADSSQVPSSVQEPRNTVEARRRARASQELERIVPFVRKLERFVPEPVKDLGLRLIAKRRPIDEISWDPKVLAEVRSVLQEDAHRFLEHFGKPMDFWDLGRSVHDGG